MIYPIIPLFLVSVLHAPMSVIGLIESIAESTASILKVFSGWISDKLGKRKPLIVLGYGLSALSKPWLALSGSWIHVLLIRFADRFGKGIRTSPRDALIADSSSCEARGKAFGLHRAMDTVGAAIGPLIAFFVLLKLKNAFRLIFILAAVPGLLGFLVLLLFVNEKKKIKQTDSPKITFRSFDKNLIHFTLICAVFSAGNFSDAFLILRAKELGISTVFIPLLYFCFNLTYSLAALPAGILSDKIGRDRVIKGGFFLFALLYSGFALAKNIETIWLLFIAYGFYYALTEGIQKAMVADLAPPSLRGTAMGTFNFTIGLAGLPASLTAGLLWQYFGAPVAFFYGASLAVVSGLMLSFWGRKNATPVY
ncbi:MAG: MFS transporter [Actinobacteria bacterium]|nr:MFS transporter [Actinomycetota bacterium]